MADDELIRFVTSNRHPPYGHRTGVFQVAYELGRQNGLVEPGCSELRSILDWFSAHLAKPERFTRSRYPRAKNTAISWIRSSAIEHTRKLRQLVKLVESAGIEVEELRTTRPGYLVYEDRHQVVALPFTDTPR
jgi:hypothetical protein